MIISGIYNLEYLVSCNKLHYLQSIIYYMSTRYLKTKFLDMKITHIIYTNVCFQIWRTVSRRRLPRTWRRPPCPGLTSPRTPPACSAWWPPHFPLSLSLYPTKTLERLSLHPARIRAVDKPLQNFTAAFTRMGPPILGCDLCKQV